MAELKGLAWFEHHMEEFVKPQLGKIPNIDRTEHYVVMMTPAYLRALKGLWNQAKRRAAGGTILLPGRDVFLLEILARMEGYPTIFRPDISGDVAEHISAEDKAAYKHLLCIDTGFRGSVPKKMGNENWLLVRYNPGLPLGVVTPKDLLYGSPAYYKWWQGVNLPQLKEHQLFPYAGNHYNTPLNNLTGVMEGCAKYWERGQWLQDGHMIYWSNGSQASVYKGPNKIQQELSNTETFRRAAAFTQHIVGMEYKPKQVYVSAALYKQVYFDWLPKGMRNKIHEGLRVGGRNLGLSTGDSGSPLEAPTHSGSFSIGSAGEVQTPI